MFMFKYPLNKLTLLLLLHLLYIDQLVRGSESCWNNEKECNIKTELFKNLEFANGISMQIDCRRLAVEEESATLNSSSSSSSSISQDHLKKTELTEENNEFEISIQHFILPRFMGVQAVMLDGCQTPLNGHTYGLEFLPICHNITKAAIRHFHMDLLRPLKCGGSSSGQHLQLEYLNIQFNEIAVIEKDSFAGNHSQLRDLLIEKNSLKLIHQEAFKAIRSLENLYIVNEPVLMLRYRDLFEYTSVAHIHLESLKQVTSGIFNRLPETLQILYVANTPLDSEAVLVRNALVLANLTLTNCALQNFTLHDAHSTVKRIDLSGNVMKIFTAHENNLKDLDLSNNQLEWLPMEWLKNLTHLERLALKGNRIQALALDDLLQAVPLGLTLDISHNRLQSLQGYDKDITDMALYQVRVKCDHNPWDCLWLHKFAHYHPEKFRILQYEKFISKINVNGLECIPAEKSPTLPSEKKYTNNSSSWNTTTSRSSNTFGNVSTYTVVYGSPWELKRNQRAEALIIVFMLPLGIALLFLLLYMWIYCQKIFHLSYYRGISCIRRNGPQSSQRFDVVRQLPPRPQQTQTRTPLTRIEDDNEESGYEVPMNGILSECNCKLQHCDAMAKCQKSVHITYEHLPTEEPPHRIYEEIVETEPLQDIAADIGNNNKQKQQQLQYDQLSFP